MKIKTYSREQFIAQLKFKFKQAFEYRKLFEAQWLKNEQVIYRASSSIDSSVSPSFNSFLELDNSDMESSSFDIGINYAMKHIRYIHAQMSANPPSVTARATSSDIDDRRKADAADRTVTHLRKQQVLQEKQDQQNLKALTLGTGWMKTIQDPNGGDILTFDKSTNEVTMEGAEKVYSPSTWDIWIDADARTWEEVRYMFERHRMPLVEAKMLFPEYADELSKVAANKSADSMESLTAHRAGGEESVEVFEYYEKGLPFNGMAGCHVWHLIDGTVLSEPTANPFAFPTRRANKDESPGPPTARLPYHILTDIDVADQVYGKSILEYVADIQDIINRLDRVTLDNIQAHGVYRMVIPESADMQEQAVSDSPYSIMKIAGNQGPWFVPPAGPTPLSDSLRLSLKSGQEELVGVNESMTGQVNRELSGFSIQTAINAGNMVRRRLYNKYTLCVESIYRGLLDIVCKHWDIPHIVMVLGREKAFEAVKIKGADIDGGYDLVLDYGTSFSLDPSSRREEIMQLVPLFKEAGLPVHRLVAELRLNNIQGLFDLSQAAGERQREIIEEMLAKNIYIEPRKIGEHKMMLDYLKEYLHSAEFRDLSEDQKQLIERHYTEREALAVQSATGEATAPGAIPAQPGILPQPMEGAPGGTPAEAMAGTPAVVQ